MGHDNIRHNLPDKENSGAQAGQPGAFHEQVNQILKKEGPAAFNAGQAAFDKRMNNLVGKLGENKVNNQGQIGQIAGKELPPINVLYPSPKPTDQTIPTSTALQRAQIETDIKTHKKKLNDQLSVHPKGERSVGESAQIATSHDRLAGMYEKLGDQDKVKEYSDQSRQIWESIAKKYDYNANEIAKALEPVLGTKLAYRNPAVAAAENHEADEKLRQAKAAKSPETKDIKLRQADAAYSNALDSLQQYSQLTGGQDTSESATAHLGLAHVAVTRFTDQKQSGEYLLDADSPLTQAGRLLPKEDERMKEAVALQDEIKPGVLGCKREIHENHQQVLLDALLPVMEAIALQKSVQREDAAALNAQPNEVRPAQKILPQDKHKPHANHEHHPDHEPHPSPKPHPHGQHHLR